MIYNIETLSKNVLLRLLMGIHNHYQIDGIDDEQIREELDKTETLEREKQIAKDIANSGYSPKEVLEALNIMDSERTDSLNDNDVFVCTHEVSLDKKSLMSNIVDAITNKEENALKHLFDKCSGKNIPVLRSSISELIATSVKGEDFWWFVKVALVHNPLMLRKPIVDALYGLTNIDKFVVADTSKKLDELLELLFQDPEKVSQDVDFLFCFKEFYNKPMSNHIKKVCKSITQPDTFVKLFQIFPQLIGEEKVDFLLEIRNKASLYMICRLFADKNIRTNMSSDDFAVYRYAVYRKSICDSLSNTVAAERVAVRFIRSTIENISKKEQETIQKVFDDGFRAFEKLVANETRKEHQKNMDEFVGNTVSGKIIMESANHFIVNLLHDGLSGLLPKMYCDKPKFEIGETVSVKILDIDKKKNVYFLTQMECTIQDFFQIPLANIGDEVILDYYHEGKVCNVRSGCLKMITPIVLNQKEKFDYKAKYHSIIVGRRTFFDYEMKILYSNDSPLHGKYRLNKVARDLNVGIQTIVQFLAKKGHQVDTNPNTKITAQQYYLVLTAFENERVVKQKESLRTGGNRVILATKNIDNKYDANNKKEQVEDSGDNNPKPMSKMPGKRRGDVRNGEQ